MPTLLDLAGVEIPDSVEGLSMVGQPRRSALYECGEDASASRMLRDERYKLIYYPLATEASYLICKKIPMNALTCPRQKPIPAYAPT